MRRLFTVFTVIALVMSAGLSVYALIADRLGMIILGLQIAILTAVAYLVFLIRRSRMVDCPPWFAYAAGREAEYRRGRKARQPDIADVLGQLDERP